jgi:HK97 gp10 family phage protein
MAGGKSGITIDGTKRVIKILAYLKSEFPKTATSVLENLAKTTTEQMKKTAPVDTGNLRNNISYSVSGTTVTISSDAEYSGFVNYGTKYQRAQWFFTNGVEFAEQRLLKMMVDELKKDIKSR